MDILQVQRLSSYGVLPKRASDFDAGYDLASAEDVVIPATGKALVRTDIAITVPYGTYGRIAPRSGLALLSHISVGAGVVDRGYTGNVGVVLFNHAEREFVVKKGDRIAQLIVERILTPEVVQVETLERSVRGDTGFGSTG